MTDPDPLAEVLRGLRRDYLRDSVARVAELEALLRDVAAGGTPAMDALRRALHKLAGSGGSYGFDEISRVSREGEHTAQRLIQAGGDSPPDADDLATVRQTVAALAAAFAAARAATPDVASD